jgi:hypothetical protein
MTAERTYPSTGQDSVELHETTRLQADGGARDGPHETPDPLPDAGDDERTLFQAAVDGGHSRLNPPGGETGIQARDRDPDGAIRVWVSGVDHNPTPRVTVAVEDDREVVTISASAWPDSDCLREWAGNIRHRTDDTGTVGIDGAEVRLASRGGGAEVRDGDPDGVLSVGWADRHAGVSVGVGTGDSWADVCVVGDDRDELAHAAETAAAVIDTAD